MWAGGQFIDLNGVLLVNTVDWNFSIRNCFSFGTLSSVAGKGSVVERPAKEDLDRERILVDFIGNGKDSGRMYKFVHPFLPK